MKKKKLLIINDLLSGGGVEKLCYDFIWYWHEAYDITFLVFGEVKKEDFYNMFPVDVKFETLHWFRDLKFYNKLKVYYEICGKLQSDSVYRKLNHKKFDLLLAMKEGKVMDVVSRKLEANTRFAWVHTDYSVYYYTKDIFSNAKNELSCMESFQKVICVSAQIESSIKLVIGDPNNLMVNYNPVNVDDIIRKAEEAVDDVCTDETDKVRFVSVGRLNMQKGYDLLLEACHMLDKDGMKYELWIVGGAEPGGEEARRLEASHKRLGTSHVKFLGAKSNPYVYMKRADWFISSSIFEGYSLVSQEAALLDVPILATDCSGVRELLGNDEYGIVLEPSVWGIYEGMKKVIQDHDLHTYYKQKIGERKNIIGYEKRFQEIESLFV